VTSARFALFLLSFVLPVALWTGSTSYEPAKLLLWALAAAAWFALLAVAIARRRTLTMPPRGLLLAGASLLLVMAPGLWRATAPALVVRAMLWSTLWWVTALTTALVLRNRHDLRRLLWCATGGVAVVCLYGLLQIAQILPGPGEWSVPSGISTLGNENYVAELAAVWLLPSLLVVLGAGGELKRAAALTICALLLGMLVFSSAAAARFAAAAAAVFALTGWLLIRLHWNLRAPVILGALALTGALTAGALVTDMLTPAPDPESSTSWTARVFAANHGAIRRTDWLVAQEQWRHSPLFGRGAGNYGVDWPDARAALTRSGLVAGLAEQTPVATRAHHEYLQLAAELGWAGVAWLSAALLAGVLAWARCWRAAASNNDRHALLLLTAGLAAAAVTGLVSFPAHLPASALAMALLTGALWSPAIGPPASSVRTRRLPRWIAAAPLAVALALAVGAMRAFEGDLWIARGSRLFVGGALGPAVAPLRAGIEHLPWTDEARLYLGLALAATGQPDEAARTLDASLRDRPSFEALLALAELHLDGRRFDQASQLIAMVEECRPALTFQQQAGYLRALSALRREQLDDAHAQFTALITNDPEDHRSWLGLGYLQALEGDRDAAAGCYRRAIMALEAKIAAPAPLTAVARGQTVRWRAHLETARRALASVTTG
jgi:tetratricopeptide (TPR) repeat protein